MRELTYAEAVSEALRLEMRRDPNVFIAGEDVGRFGSVFGACAGVYQEFGDRRAVDTPIAEQGIVGLAVGAAATGLRPVVEIQFFDFITYCMDQLVNQAAKMKYMFGGKARLPFTVRTPGGGGLGAAAQHSQMLEAWLCHVPGLKVVIPSTPADAKGLLTAAIRDDDPVIVVENKSLYGSKGPVPEGEYVVPLGKADVKRAGKDVTVIATSAMVNRVLKVAADLAATGIDVEVLDPRSLVPLDRDAILASVRKTRKALVVHEAVKFAGIGAEIAAMIAEEAFDDLDAPVRRLAAPFTPVPFTPVLEREYTPSEEKIAAAIQALVA